MAIGRKPPLPCLCCSIFLLGTLLAPTCLRTAQKQKKDDLPRIQPNAGKELLILPEKLKQLIREQLAGFRVPGYEDRTGYWGQDTNSGKLHYAVWGDFRGGGHTDVALILLGNKEWELVIFHQTPDGYSVGYTNGRKLGAADALVDEPQLLYLELIPKGKPYVITNIGASGKGEKRYTFTTDAIEFGGIESFQSVVYWKNGKYQTMDFSD